MEKRTEIGKEERCRPEALDEDRSPRHYAKRFSDKNSSVEKDDADFGKSQPQHRQPFDNPYRLFKLVNPVSKNGSQDIARSYLCKDRIFGR